MQFLILAAVAAVASASTVARCGECSDYTPIKIEKKCVVVADEDNWTLGVGACSEAVKFEYDAETHYLHADVEGKCVAAVEVDGAEFVGLVDCEESDALFWKPQKGGKWLCEKTCQCIDVNEDGLLTFGPCKKASKCGMPEFPKHVKPECKPKPAPAEQCGAMPACPETCSCKDSHCVQPLQCYHNDQCAYGQECNNGWCVYKKPTCGNSGLVCPDGYVCDEYCGQCVLPPKKCPPGYEQEGYWCVPVKQECDWYNRCPAGYYCDCGICKPETQLGCDVNADCADNQVCSRHGICVPAPACLPGCLGDCIHGECVPKCTANTECPAGQVCEGGICVIVENYCLVNSDCLKTEACENNQCAYQASCDTCKDTCEYGVCPGANDGRRAAGVLGWF